MLILGLAGYSGSGKTTLLTRLISYLKEEHGLKLSTIKHVHHAIEPDSPGKDSYRHRQAGADEVAIMGENLYALMGAPNDTTRPDEIIKRMKQVDILFIEGWKFGTHQKIEIHDPDKNEPLMARGDENICAVIGPRKPDEMPDKLPWFHRDSIDDIAVFILTLKALNDTK